MPAEFFALANAFFFALHSLLTKKGLCYCNPATAVIASLIMNVIIVWGVLLLFTPLDSLTSPGIQRVVEEQSREIADYPGRGYERQISELWQELHATRRS